MLGVKTAQTALRFGADDLDGTVQEEKIYHMAGAETPQAMTPNEIVRLIRNAGRSPVERDTLYNVVAEGEALGGAAAGQIELQLEDVLAQAAGDVDLALIPTAAYREIEAQTSLRAVPGIGITSFGNVRTVLLVGEVPWEQLTAISLDGASRSSAALVRHLTRHRGLTPRVAEVVHGDIEGAAHDTTGALVKGDAGFAVAD